MTALKLKLDHFENRDSPSKRNSLASSLKSKFFQVSAAYKTVGGTGYSDSKVFAILRDLLQPDTKISQESAVQ